MAAALSMEVVYAAVVALLPVLVFLVALFCLDSYKLLPVRSVILALIAGVAVAGASYPVNASLLSAHAMEVGTFSRYVSPWVEELLKGLVIVALVRAHRIGFLVDAAIIGFAVGSGFALAENLYYLHLAAGAGMGTWIVRGFGTALMHGGTTALFAVIGLARLERSPRWQATTFLPGFLLAVALHSGFNHLNHAPHLATLVTLLTLPPLLWWVWERSERALSRWLGQGFDVDATMLELIDSGRLAESPAGHYLESLKRNVKGTLAADALSYLRLYTELSLRAKGVLMMRENGFEPRPLDDATRAKFVVLRRLEQRLGSTGLRALRPLLGMRHKDLWQLHMLEAGG